MIRLVGLLAMLLLVSCEEKEVTSSPEELRQKLSFHINVQKAREGDDIKYLRKFIKKTIKGRQKSLPGQLWDLPTFHLTPYGVAVNGGRAKPKDAEGMWYKFNKDYTYAYGRYDNVVGSGIYHYADSDEFLVMLDNDGQIEPKLFKLLSNSEMFNFVGQPIMLIDDGKGERMLWKNFAQDGFLETVKINHQLHNGSQIVMKMEATRPVASAR